MNQPRAKASALLALALVLIALLFYSGDPRNSHPSGSEPDKLTNVSRSLQENTQELLEKATTHQGEDAPLLKLAHERSQAMSELIASDPERALELAFSYAEYAALPEQIQALVERPFTETADYRVLIVCDHEAEPNHLQHSIKRSDGHRIHIPNSSSPRLELSKEATPIQGIELNGAAAIRPAIFQILEGDDIAWANQQLPLANSDAASDFLTGQSLGSSPVTAISGGYRFLFSSPESAAALETKLAHLDGKPGLHLGSGALLAKLAQNTETFNAGAFFAAQEAAALPPTDEVRDYLIIRVDFADLPGTPYTQAELESLVDNNVAPNLAKYSYNKTTVNVTVSTSSYQLPASTTFSNTDDLHDAAVQAYMSDGNPDPSTLYDVVSVNFPELDTDWTKFAGLASVGGREQWLESDVSAETILHELGHNYGLLHATYWKHDYNNAQSLDPIDPNGVEIDYGDIFDVMGDGKIREGHFHMAAKMRLGWLGSANLEDLSTASDSGIYRVYAFDNVSATGIQAIRVPKSGSDEYYWIGHRQMYPGIPNFANGAYLLWERPTNFNSRSMLIDTTPGSAEGRSDAGLALGRTFSDSASGLHITPLAAGQDAQGSYLDIAINIGNFSGNQAPSGTLNAATTGTARTGIPFSFTGSDPDGDSLAYHWDFGDGTVEESSESIDHVFPVGGTYTLKLTVSDRKGGTFSQQSTVVIDDPISQTTSRTSNTPYHLTALATDGHRVVAGGYQGVFLYSDDGIVWNDASLPFWAGNLKISEMLWTGSEYIAIGSDFSASQRVGTAYVSTDGESWSLEVQSSESIENWGFQSVAYDPSSQRVVIVQSDAKVRVRDAAGNWSIVDLGFSVDSWKNGGPNGAAVTWTGTSFILGAYNFAPAANTARLTILRSPNGTDWTRVNAADTGLLDWYGLTNLDFLNGQLLGSGFAAGLLYSEDDGLTWQNNQPTATYEPHTFAYGNGVYSAHAQVGENTYQDLLSTDGKNWRPAGDPGVLINDRIFFLNTFISVGGNGLILQSSEFNPLADPAFSAWIVGFISDEADQGALANPDFDWAPNFMEFALGSDPSDPASVPTPPSLQYNESGTLSINIPRFAKTEIPLSLESSTDLAAWTDLDAAATIDTATILQLTTTQTFDNADSIFIRIKANQ